MAGRRSKKSPFSGHPLFTYRRGLLVANVIGLLLGLGMFSNYSSYEVEVWAFACGLFFVSILLVQWDFYDWKDHKGDQEASRNRLGAGRVQHYGTCSARSGPTQQGERAPLLDSNNVDDNDGNHRLAPGCNSSSEDDEREWTWPRKAVMVIDFILAVLSIFLYATELGMIGSYSYSYNNNVVGQSYISVCTLVCSFIHAKCWWVEFVARMKLKWEEERQEALEGEGATVDLEAARNQCPCNGGDDTGSSPAVQNDHTEESRILSRVLRFLGRNNGDATFEETSVEQQPSNLSHFAADTNTLTPESSSSERQYEQNDEHLNQSKAGLGVESSRTVNAASQDAVLVIKKNKSKKGKEKEDQD